MIILNDHARQQMIRHFQLYFNATFRPSQGSSDIQLEDEEEEMRPKRSCVFNLIPVLCSMYLQTGDMVNRTSATSGSTTAACVVIVTRGTTRQQPLVISWCTHNFAVQPVGLHAAHPVPQVAPLTQLHYNEHNGRVCR